MKAYFFDAIFISIVLKGLHHDHLSLQFPER